MQNESKNQSQEKNPASENEKQERREIEIPKPLSTAEKIKRKRGKDKQEVFAKKLKISQSYLSKIEKGNSIPDNEKLQEFARKLGVNVFDLIADDVEIEAGSNLDRIALCLNCEIPPSDSPFLYGSHYMIPLIDQSGDENSFCRRCGRKLMTQCPICNKHIIISDLLSSHESIFCPKCGRLLVPHSSRFIKNKEGKITLGTIDPMYGENELIYYGVDAHGGPLYQDYFRFRVIKALGDRHRDNDHRFDENYEGFSFLEPYLEGISIIVESDDFKEYLTWAKSEFAVGPGYPSFEDDIWEKVKSRIHENRNKTKERKNENE